jgi:hypothetical protein
MRGTALGRFRAGPLGVSLVLIFAAGGCGGATGAPATVKQATNAAQPATAAPVRHLSILSPRVGAHTAPTLTVRVRLTGTATSGAQRFRYELDHRLTRSGADRLTFHDLAPGRHRLEVIWASADPSRAATTFTVRAPAPVTVPAPAQAQPTASTPATSPASTTPPPSTSTPTQTSAAPPPPQTSPPPSGGGIPQGPNAGDGDGDNKGGPSDGDGNL